MLQRLLNNKLHIEITKYIILNCSKIIVAMKKKRK